MASKEKPIIFDGASVRAILAGAKTQTRRAVTVGNTLVDGTGGCRWWDELDLDDAFVARLLITVTDVRVQRVRDINCDDIAAEGVDNGASNPTMGKRHANMQRLAFESRRGCGQFRSLSTTKEGPHD